MPARKQAAKPGMCATGCLAMLRCLAALAEWSKLTAECRKEWTRAESHVRRDMAGLAAHAAWHMGDWDEMAQYTNEMRTSDSSTGSFLSAVQAVHNQDFARAKSAASAARKLPPAPF